MRNRIYYEAPNSHDNRVIPNVGQVIAWLISFSGHGRHTSAGYPSDAWPLNQSSFLDLALKML